MMVDSSHADGIPEPLDGDDDDVAWALQTAAVEWRRAAVEDAITWLWRAVSSADDAGHAPRSAQLAVAANKLAARVAREQREQRAESAPPRLPNPPSPPPAARPLPPVEEDELVELEEIEAVESAAARPRRLPEPARRPPVAPSEGDEYDGLDSIDAADAIDVSFGSFTPAARRPSLPPPLPSPGGAVPTPPMPPAMRPRAAHLPPPPVGLATRPGASEHPIPGVRGGRPGSASPGRLGAISAIAHPPQGERRRPSSELPPSVRRDSSLGPPPGSDAGSYFPGVLGERPLPRRPGSAKPATPVRDGTRTPLEQATSVAGAAEPSPESRPPRGRRPLSDPPRSDAPQRPLRSEPTVAESGQRRPEAAAATRAAARRAGARVQPGGARGLPELPAEHPETMGRGPHRDLLEAPLPLVSEDDHGDAEDLAGEDPLDRVHLGDEDDRRPASVAREPTLPPLELISEVPRPPRAPTENVPELPDLEEMALDGPTDSLMPPPPDVGDGTVDYEGGDDEGGDDEGGDYERGDYERGDGMDDVLPDLDEVAPPAVAAHSVPPASTEPSVLGVRFSVVRGFQDLAVESQLLLAKRAKLEVLQPEEEVSFFAVALVVKGDVSIVPAVSDVPCSYAQKGEVVFTQGSLADGIALSVVAGPDGAAVAAWDRAALEAALEDSPWVADELAEIADRFQALAGATMGPLGQRLDESLMASIFAKATVRHLFAGDVFLEAGSPVHGLGVVGAGRIEIVAADGTSAQLGPGDLVFPELTPSSGRAPATARAGASGALVLHVPRHETHELIVSLPPLLEVLATS